MTWTDLPISLALAREVDPEKVPDQETVDKYDLAAKNEVEMRVLDVLGRYTARYGGPKGLMDAIADKAAEGEPLANQVQNALAHAVAYKSAMLGRNGEDRWLDDAAEYKSALGRAIRSISQTAPFVIGANKVAGRSAGGAAASTYDAF